MYGSSLITLLSSKGMMGNKKARGRISSVSNSIQLNKAKNATVDSDVALVSSLVQN